MEKKLRIDTEKRELPVHIHQGFPIGIVTSHFSADTYDIVNWHWHEEIQYNVVLQGSFCFRVAGKEYNVKEGNGLFINTQNIHMSKATSPDSVYLFVYFHPSLLTDRKDSYFYKEYISSLLSDEYSGSFLLDQNVPADKKVIDAIKQMQSIYEQKKSGYELDILSQLIQLWKHTVFCAEGKGMRPSSNDTLANERLKMIFLYISLHYGEPINLDDISTHVGLSRSECSRFFKSYTGQNLFRYLIHYRVNKSVELLLNTDRSIAEIAYEVGFNSQSYYTKCFVSIKKKTPNAVRGEFRNV
ncbi:MAG: AraC family transcriptional regulator [Clostridia bacterium]|nr:AraC family transcriptional regulator [Clostridia bacterium]